MFEIGGKLPTVATWDSQPDTLAKVEECVPRTRVFLLKYDRTPTSHGSIGRERDEQPTAFGVDGIAIARSIRTSALPALA